LTGSGKVRAWIRRQRVDLEMGTKASTWGWRMKPVSGSGKDRVAGVEERALETAAIAAVLEWLFGMIEPHNGGRR
jgi:hypothetical protein